MIQLLMPLKHQALIPWEVVDGLRSQTRDFILHVAWGPDDVEIERGEVAVIKRITAKRRALMQCASRDGLIYFCDSDIVHESPDSLRLLSEGLEDARFGMTGYDYGELGHIACGSQMFRGEDWMPFDWEEVRKQTCECRYVAAQLRRRYRLFAKYFDPAVFTLSRDRQTPLHPVVKLSGNGGITTLTREELRAMGEKEKPFHLAFAGETDTENSLPA